MAKQADQQPLATVHALTDQTQGVGTVAKVGTDAQVSVCYLFTPTRAQVLSSYIHTFGY